MLNITDTELKDPLGLARPDSAVPGVIMRLVTVLLLAALCGCNCGSRISGVSSELVADPVSLDFGTLPPSGTATRSVLVRNSSTARILLSSETIGGVDATRFALMAPPIGQLRADEDAVMSVVFTAPATPNTLARAELVFVSDAVNPRLTVLLYGSSGAIDAGLLDPDGGKEFDGGTPDAGGEGPDGGCAPRTCRDANADCGTVNDGCGGELQCGECTPPQVCGAGQPNVCSAGPGSCQSAGSSVPAPSMAGPSSTCAVPMPPAVGIPCDIPTPGMQYYVSSTTGNDNNDGLSPSTPWATLNKALCASASGSTVRVAAGVYLTADVLLNRPLTLKGGYDATFTTWDPDAHHSIIAGRPRLSDDRAVLGGFRIIRRTNDQGAILMTAGQLIRNYVELLLDATPVAGGEEGENLHTSYGIIAGARTDKTVIIACNDVYGRNIPAAGGDMRLLNLISLEAHSGRAVIDSNRLCLDSYAGSYASAVIDGNGSCDRNKVASVTVTNNILEGRAVGASGFAFFGCENDLSLVVTNNTVLSTAPVVYAYDGANSAGRPVPTQWWLTNNVFAGLNATTVSAFDVLGPATGILSAEGNLIFGYRTNAPSPIPQRSGANDFTGSASLASTFVDWVNGDFRPLPMGPAATGGINVDGLQMYGSVTLDLEQRARPDAGPWARGALMP